MVHEPWSMPYLFVPQNSTVIIDCTASASSSSPESTPIWSIAPAANNSNSPQLQFSTSRTALNDLGFYNLSSIKTSDTIILRLMINGTTAENNQTEIFCDLGMESYNTTLLVYGKHTNKYHSS